MNFKTPKSAKYSQKESPSPKKLATPKSALSSKQSPSVNRSRLSQQQSAQSSLILKLIQAQISSQDQYQNLLIKNKQLEIKILQLQSEAQALKKGFKKASKPLEQVKAKIQSSKLSLVQKQKYLEKYYVHLDNRLKNNMHSNLFGKLQKIQAALQNKYEQQKQVLYSGLASQHENMQAANQKLMRLKEYRDQLIKQYTERVMDSSNRIPTNQSHRGSEKKSTKEKSQKRSAHGSSSKKSHQEKLLQKNRELNQAKNKQKQERRKRKEKKKNAKIQTKHQCEKFKENIVKYKKQKEMAQKDQKLLKQLLNIEEEHKKHSVYIMSGYKKMFTIQYRHMVSSRKKSPTVSRGQSPENNPMAKSQGGSSLNRSQRSELYQSTVSMPDVEGLQKTLSQIQGDREKLQREVEERNAALDKCKERLNEDIGEYSRLEEQIMRISNKNLGGSYREPNYRMTYAESQNAGNHRSTYTSYQQRSDHLDEDL